MNRSRLPFSGAVVLAATLTATAVWAADATPRKKPAPSKPSTASRQTAGAAGQALPEGLTRLEVQPTSVTLVGPRATQRLVVTAVTKDGATVDVTDRVEFTVGNAKVATVSGGVLRPMANGETRLFAWLGKLASPRVAIVVRDAQSPATVSFLTDVVPILSKAGCNSTTCHGSPVGQAGFKLSLFGYEPDADHAAIVQDGDGRRVNRDDPARSLILRKATAAVSHGGGRRFGADSPQYRTLLAWLKEGAPGLVDAPRVTGVTVLPARVWAPKPEARQRLIVTATFSDGSTRDVTEQALFSGNDDAIAEVDADGRVTARRPGETAIMVRYLGQVSVARIAVLPPWQLPRSPTPAKHNFIDEHVQAKLKALRVLPSDVCTDAEFIRRATLDTCGIIPTVEEVRAFIADASPDKRAKLIDRLLSRPEFVDLWTLKWNDTLRNNPRLTRQGLLPFSNWIREQIRTNRPYDAFVRDLLTATGKTADIRLDPANLPPQLQRLRNAERLVEQINSAPFNPAANYFAVPRDPLELASATSQIFLGVRIDCARCHNHPFEKWTQNDYYHLAAFFSGVVTRGNNQTPAIVTVNARGRGIRHPRTGEPVEPRTLDGSSPPKEAGASNAEETDRRAALAAWITSPENPFFAKAAVNRIWAHYFGRGIVEPIDDFRATNPPSNPELLEVLAKEFITSGFNVRHVHRLILNSRAYQQSSRPNATNRHDTSNFARFYPRRMMAEQLYDSISQATSVFLPIGGRNGGRRALIAGGVFGADGEEREPITRVLQLPALPGGGGQGRAGQVRAFLDTFGKPRREVVCECERSTDGNVSQALALINGEIVNEKIAAPRGRVQRLIREEAPDAAVVEELYLATLSRLPDAAERREAAALIRAAPSRAEGIADLMWGLLNSREFLFIH